MHHLSSSGLVIKHTFSTNDRSEFQKSANFKIKNLLLFTPHYHDKPTFFSLTVFKVRALSLKDLTTSTKHTQTYSIFFCTEITADFSQWQKCNISARTSLKFKFVVRKQPVVTIPDADIKGNFLENTPELTRIHPKSEKGLEFLGNCVTRAVSHCMGSIFVSSSLGVETYLFSLLGRYIFRRVFVVFLDMDHLLFTGWNRSRH